MIRIAVTAMALAMPLLLFLVAGVLDLGMLFWDKHVLTNAAREGARAAAKAVDIGTAVTAELSQSQVRAVVQNDVDQYALKNLNGSALVLDNSMFNYTWTTTGSGTVLTVNLNQIPCQLLLIPNIKTLFESIPPYWAPMKKMLVLRVGDAENDEEFNKKISPLFHVDSIRAPLLIGQGKNDPRVNIRESDQIVEAMRAKNLFVKYIVYTDEGHGFARPENNLDFAGYVDEFLAKYLGGRFEPYQQVKGSSGEEH